MYTPVEVVDFILNSANDALKAEFGVGLTDENVHILDPFTGTGTFIVRLLQSAIIADKDLARKYRQELHANEIILLAYYIAAINIEEAFHGRAKKDYELFEGIVLTDTFQLSEGKGTFDDPNFQVNSARALKQNKRDIRVILGNPPYSALQESENDANKNLKYPQLDDKIRNTYAAYSSAVLKNSLYDSYVRALRWASDRVKDNGVICFVSNGSYIDGNVFDGLRKCLADEFAGIYVFNLRGNQRTQGETSRMEGGKIFGSGSRAQIAITLWVKKSGKNDGCKIHYYAVDDYLTREEKLAIVKKFTGSEKIPWQQITPNKSHDWINQRDPAFEKFMPIGDKDDPTANPLFVTYSHGVKTNRDCWCYNFSKSAVAGNMRRMVEFYNEQVAGFAKVSAGKEKDDLPKLAESWIDTDAKKISWSRALKQDLCQLRKHSADKSKVRQSRYRPFCAAQLYFDREFNDVIGQTPKLFPDETTKNLAIGVVGPGTTKDFSPLITNVLPDYELLSKGQYFPLRYYVPPDAENRLHSGHGEWRENISGYALAQFRGAYKDQSITGEDIFYYVYGVLHSPEYKTRFTADLKKMLPRIPFAADFWAFSRAGRKLADIHLHYESAKLHPVKERADELGFDAKRQYEVQKMRFGKKGKEVDKTVIHLKARDVQVWVDYAELKVGDSIVGRISQGLQDADYLMAVLSKSAVQSAWVRSELNFALMEQLTLWFEQRIEICCALS